MLWRQRRKQRLSSGTCNIAHQVLVCLDLLGVLVVRGCLPCPVGLVDPVVLVDQRRLGLEELELHSGPSDQLVPQGLVDPWVLADSCHRERRCQEDLWDLVFLGYRVARVDQLGLVGLAFLVEQVEPVEQAGPWDLPGQVDQVVQEGLLVVVDKLGSSREWAPVASCHRVQSRQVCQVRLEYRLSQGRQLGPWVPVGIGWLALGLRSCILEPVSSA